MLRRAALLVPLVMTAGGCGEPRIVMKPLPELVVQAPRSAITVPELLLIPGESLIWDVHWHGLTIGRAELVVTETEARSKFKTGRLVSSVANVEHELTTILDRNAALPQAMTERIVEGETQRFEAQFAGAHIGLTTESKGEPTAQVTPLIVPGGNHAHTLHSAIGVLRAWAEPGCPYAGGQV